MATDRDLAGLRLRPPREIRFPSADAAVRWALRSPLDARGQDPRRSGGGGAHALDEVIETYSRIVAVLGQLSLLERWLVTRYAELLHDPDAHLGERGRPRGSYATLERELRREDLGMRTERLRRMHKDARERVRLRLLELDLLEESTGPARTPR